MSKLKHFHSFDSERMIFVIITAALAGILSVESTENTRCFNVKLDFSGLRRGRENWYEDGHVIQIACEAGYQINDEAEVKCSEGEWTANVPPCTPVDCPEPPTIPYANLEKTSTTHGSYAIYAFQDPYKLIGHVRVQCLFGEWISVPRCNDGSCDLNNLTHSNEISREETPHYANSGQRLRVICKAGYSPSKYARLYCSAGKWRRNFGSLCKKDSCLVPKVKSGYIAEKVYGDYYWDFWKAKHVREINNAKVPYGTLVKPNATYYLHCDSGNSYQGSSETEKRMTCIESYWDPEPVCIPRSSRAAELKNDVTTPVPQDVTCEKPLPPEQGSVQFSDEQSVGSIATYLCEEGTTLVGVSSSKCLENGVWTFDPPKCLITCEKPLPPEGGSVQFSDGQSVGSIATYLCGEGTTLVGVSSTKCLENGVWTFDPPKCLRSCIIPVIENGVIGFYKTVRNFRGTYQQFVQFQVGETVKPGESAVLRCQREFIPVNLTTSRNGDTENIWCREGVWSTSMQCAPSKCLEEPPAIENGSPVVPSNTNGTVIWYTCEPGLEKLKGGHVECVYGTWIGYTSVCGDSRCFINSLNYPGLILPATEYLHSSRSFDINCEAGYEKTSSKKKIRCSKGKWEVESNPCSISDQNNVSCNKFEDSEHLNVVYSNDVNVGSIATFSCVSPYTLVGSHLASCQQNGTWNSTLPSCEVSKCPVEDLLLSLPDNVLPDLRNVTVDYVPYGAEIQFLCDSSSLVSGSLKAKCGRGGGWEFGVVRCIQRCVLGEISPQLVVEPVKEHYLFGEQVTFSCPRGQKLSSEVRRVTCMGTSWSDPIPDCVEAVYRGK